MKIIISENRIHDLAYKYLKSYYGGLEPFTHKRINGIIFFNKGEKTIFTVYLSEGAIDYSPEIFYTIKRMFSFTDDEVYDLIDDFMKKEYHIDFKKKKE